MKNVRDKIKYPYLYIRYQSSEDIVFNKCKNILDIIFVTNLWVFNKVWMVNPHLSNYREKLKLDVRKHKEKNISV